MTRDRFRKIIASVLLFTNSTQVLMAAVPDVSANPTHKLLQSKPTLSKQNLEKIKSQKVDKQNGPEIFNETNPSLLENYSFAPTSIQELMGAPSASSAIDKERTTKFWQPFYPTSSLGRSYPLVSPTQQSLNLSTERLGITGPVTAGVDYSDLTGLYFNGQILKKINDALGFNILGEYGSRQYRLNGTIGFLIAAQTFFKVSAEQLAQKLPFSFTTGRVDEQVKQNAVGGRFQRGFDIASLSVGAYLAKAANKRLGAVPFVSNGSNCLGFEAGFLCINERNIAGGRSSGGDLGLSTLLNRNTYLEGRVYYDTVRYDTIFTARSIYDKSGYGGGIYAQHLLTPNIKLSSSAEIRKIYDTYNISLSWMPPFINASGTEFSLVAQHVESHNPTPNNNSIALKVTFFADKINYQAPIYGLNNLPLVDNIGSWISQPAVKMNQVLAVAEEYIHLAASTIASITPSFGPLSGGNTVTITGSNFPSGLMVKFGANIAQIVSQTMRSITVIVPEGDRLGGVTVSITRPDGEVTNFQNGYLYINGTSPLLTSQTPSIGPVSGGTAVTLTGANFVRGETSVYLDNIQIPASAVTVNSSTSLTFTTPPHPEGTVLVFVTTNAGPSGTISNGYTYVGIPTITSVTPNSAATAGGEVVTIIGSDFVTGATTVTIGGVVVPASSVTVNSSTSISFPLPPHAGGSVDIVVTTPGGTATLPGGFNYSDSAATAITLSPQYGTSSGGTNVIVNGNNFDPGATSVTIGTTVIPPSSVTVNGSGQQLTFSTPPGSQGNVSVIVTTPQGSTGSVPGGFNFVDPPVASTVTPDAGPLAGNTSVNLNGQNFVSGNTVVSIGGTDLSGSAVIVNSSTSLTFTTPSSSAGNAQVQVSTPGGQSNNVSGGFDFQPPPQITTDLSSSVGASTGGTPIVAIGTNFIPGGTTVTIGSAVVPPASVAVNPSGNSLSFMTPAHPIGTVAVGVTTVGGLSNSVGFTYEGGPTATSLAPSAGPIAGNTRVTVTGTNFATGNTTVTIGSTTTIATVNSSTSLTFITPPGTAGNAQVTITTPGGTTGPALIFSYNGVPAAGGLSVTAGPVAGNTSVTIGGANFVAGSTSVKIDDVIIPPTSVTVNPTGNSLTFVTPPHAAGNVSVIVSTPGGATSTIAGGFTYEDIPTTTGIVGIPAGPTSGNTSVTISGTNFVSGDTSVTIGGITIPAASVTVNSSSSLTFITPAHSAGTVDIVVATSGGSSTLTGAFTYQGAPSLAGISPAFGAAGASGTTITLSGTNFVSGSTSVIVGETVIPPASVSVSSSQSLSFPMPTNASGNVSVSVSTPGGTSNNVPQGFTYVVSPVVTGPPSVTNGSTAGGTSITLSGQNFIAGNTTVTVQGVAATSITVNSSTSITFVTPAGSVGPATIIVSNAAGNFNVAGFSYVGPPTITQIGPAFGIISGGTLVTVSGTGFIQGDTTVTIGTSPGLSVTVTSASTLTFVTPAVTTAENVLVNVTTIGGTSNNVPGGFTYVETVIPGSLNVTAGPIGGGTTVTLSGQNFVPGNTSVAVNGIPATSVTVNSSTSLTFVTPAASSAGAVPVTVTTAAGSVTVSDPFNYNNAPTITQISPVYVSAAGGTQITVTGTSFVQNSTTVTVGGVTIPSSGVTVTPPNTLTFFAPTVTAAENVAVSVTTPGGTSDNVAGGLTYEIAATIDSSTTSFGGLAGGTSVTLTGNNFVAGNTSVTVNGVPATSVTVNSSTSLTFVTPPGAAGQVPVIVSTAAGDVNVSGGFTYVASPTATQITPAFGIASGSTFVTVNGTGFVSDMTSVTMGDSVIPATSVTVTSANTLTFNTPAGSGNVTVSVTTPGGTTGNIAGGFTYEETVVVSSPNVNIGGVAGGTVVTVTGNNFVPGNTSVAVNGVPATSVTVNSSTSLTFVTPPGSPGTVPVTITTAAGDVDVPGGFTYVGAPTVTSIGPLFGNAAGGTSVSINGGGFVAGNTSVTMGGSVITPSSITVTSPNLITFNSPAGTIGNVTVSVTTPGGTVDVPGGFTYEGIPTGTALSVTSGPIAGGTLVTLTGTNFMVGDTTVTVGGNAATSVTIISPDTLTFVTPSGTTGVATVRVINSAGGTDALVSFNYEDVPTVTGISPAFGSASATTFVTLTGTGFVVGETSVRIGDVTIPPGSVTVTSNTLTFTAPSVGGTAGNVGVSVSTAGGTASVPGGFTYVIDPAISSLSPAFGSTSGNSSVTISGANFVTGNTSVIINGNTIPPASVIVNSSNSLTFTTPSNAEGSVNVLVSNASGPSPTSLTFTYEDPPTASGMSPIFGNASGPTQVTITGTGFVSGDTSVTIGGVTIPPTSVTVTGSNMLTFFAPGGAGNVTVSVSTSGGSVNLAQEFTYAAQPIINSINPTSVPTTVSVLVTVNGSNFVAGNTTVVVGSQTPSQVTVVSPNVLTFLSPLQAAGTAQVIITNAGGPSDPSPLIYNVTTPTANAISPIYGSSTGGNLVTITGTNFVIGSTSVTIGGIPVAASQVSVDPSLTSLSFNTPAHAAGNVDVFVTTAAGSSGVIIGGFIYEDIPVLGALNPNSGPMSSSNQVTISGSNFVAGDTYVTIGSTIIPASSVTVNSANSLTFTAPPGSAGSVNVTASNSAGTSLVPLLFTYNDTSPSVSLLSPVGGPSSGGTTVTITGSNFVAGSTSVTIGGTPGLSVNVTSDTSLTFITPAGIAGNAAVTVTTPIGTSGFVPNGFTYYDLPIAIGLSSVAGPMVGGTRITVTGGNFVAGATSVSIGGNIIQPSDVIVSSSFSLSFITPPTMVAGAVSVEIITTGGTSTPSLTFNYDSIPTISSVSPAFGLASGGTQVSITGSGFVTGATSITIAGTVVDPGSVIVNPPSSLTFSTPSGAVGGAAISVTTPGGTSNSIPNGFTYENIPTIGALSVNQGPAAGNTPVTISGTNFVAGDTRVIIGGVTIPVSAVTVNSSTSLSFITPGGSGSADVTVANSAGPSLTLTGGFLYAAPPTISNVSPLFGSIAGTTTVTITGTGFIPGSTSVRIGTLSPTLSSETPTTLSFTAPAVSAPGTAAISVSTIGGSSGNFSSLFTYEGDPTTSALSVDSGPTAGGTLVTITGSNFVPGDTHVNVGSTLIPANLVNVTSSTSLTFQTPNGTAGNASITVTTTANTSSPALNFIYADTPTATAISPAFGSSGGVATVGISGTNFLAGYTSVTIGGVIIPASSVVVGTSNALSFSAPAHTAGNVNVSVSTPGGVTTNIPGGFTYEDSPTATLATPAFGPTAGNTRVTITGTNFVVGDTSVIMGSTTIPPSSVTVNSSTSLSFLTPTSFPAGNVSLAVATSANSSTVPSGFTFEDPPTATSLSPAFGTSGGGTSVTISGTNFVATDTSVIIGGMVVPGTVTSSNSLTFLTPAHAAGNVAVSVKTSGGTTTDIPGGFTYENIPTLSSISPAFGSITGSNVVTITGTGFVPGDTTVTFGGIPATSVTVNSFNSLTCITPAGAAGVSAVNVINSAGPSTNNLNFTYEDVPTATLVAPAFGPIAGGTSVTVTGSNFVQGDTSVTIGGVTIPASSVTVNPPNSLTFTTPSVSTAGTVGVTVVTSGGISTNVLGFTYEIAPTGATLTPGFGSTAGGTLVTITGTNFVSGDTSVTIGSNTLPPSSVTVNNSTSLSFVTPSVTAAGLALVSVSTSGGSTGSISTGFIYELPPVATTISPAFGTKLGNTYVTITGNNFIAGDTSVMIGGTLIPTGSVIFNLDTSISFYSPVHVPGNVSVSVMTSGGASNSVLGGFTYTDQPTATSLSPAIGSVSGGASVTISGTNFVAGDTTVTIGSTIIPSSSVTVNSSTSLKFIAPTNPSSGNVPVSVSTSGGSTGAIGTGFLYVAPPTVSSLTPLFGRLTGATITITGNNFVAGDTSVLIGGITIPPTSVTVTPPNSLSFTAPAVQTAGNVAVSVSTTGGTSANVPGGFTYEATPTATSLSPAFGPVAGGTLITVQGSNFVAGDTSVSIGGTTISPSSVTIISPTSLSFLAPAHAVGNVNVTVTTTAGTTSNIGSGFTYELQPSISAVSPSYGPIAGGTTMTISGSNFVSGDTSVLIGGISIPRSSVTVLSDTSLRFNVPAHAAGNVGVSVLTSGGTSSTLNGFTYVAAPTTASFSPIYGPVAGGTAITVTGTGFVAGDTSVTIGGIAVPAASVKVNSSTSLTFNAPAHGAGSAAISVSNSGGSSTVPGSFTYELPPTASSLAPNSGTTAGSTPVTITGTNFVAGDTSVTIGGTVVPPSSVTVNSPTSLTFNTPTQSAGSVSVTVSTSGGTSSAISGGYTYLAPSMTSCTAPIPSLIGLQLITCVGANLTLFQTTFLKASGSAACSTFPTQSIVPTINVLGQVLITATNIPSILSQGLIGCNIQICSNSSCSILGGTIPPVIVRSSLL